jgi:hypothetical protein
MISLSSAFTIEVTTNFAMVFLSFGVGLDPRQREVFGPALGPIFVGLIVGMCSFFTGVSRDGYTGFCMYAPFLPSFLPSFLHIPSILPDQQPRACGVVG